MNILRGRAPLIVTPLSAFTTGINGNAPIAPFDREFVYNDENNGELGYIEMLPGGGFEFHSVEGDNKEFLDNLDYSGVFTNAQAAAIGSELTYFLFDINNRSIKINPSLSYPSTYRYYAIRKGTEFITGRVDPNTGDVLTNLVDMRLEPAQSGSGDVSKPELGMLLPNATPVDADSYIIEFFDDARNLLARDSFWAYAVRIMNYDLTSDVGITDIRIITTRPVDGEEDACFLYVNEDTAQLDMRILLMYSDGTSRDITHETATGRLVISGLSGFDTSTVTPVGDTPNTFNIKYYAVDTNGQIGNFSIDKDIKLYVRDDPNSDIITVIPALWVSYSDLTTVQRNIFAIYSSGNMVNVDNIISSISNVVVDTGVTQNLDIDLITGTSGNVHHYSYHDVRFTGDGTNSPIKSLISDTDQAHTEQFVDNNRLITLNVTASTATIQNNAGDPAQDMIDHNTLTYRDENNVIVNVLPTHFRVRNIEGTHYYVGGIGIPLSLYQNFSFDEGAHPISTDKPVILEFIRVEQGGSGNDIVVATTNARLSYVELVN